MTRLPLTLLALGLLVVPAYCQEEPIIDECAPTTLFQAFGLEDIEGCTTGDVSGDPAEGDDDSPEINRVSESAKLPGNNREAALAHANDRSNGAVAAAHGPSDGETRGNSGNSNAGGNGGGRP